MKTEVLVHRIVIASLAGALLAAPSAAQAATKTVNMGVPLKSQHGFQVLATDVNDYFPHGVTVHAGDSVKFVPTGFHDLDLPAKGKKPLQLLVNGAPVSGSLDAANNPFWFNGQPSVGFNPAVAATSNFGKKFTYTGGKTILSGLPVANHPKPVTVKFPKAGSYTFFCTVHPGMKGTVRVLAKRKRIPTAKQDAKALKRQVATALGTARTIQNVTGAADTVDVGLASAHGVEYYGFLPGTLTVPVGSVVKFQMPTGSKEVHTATTGPGNPEQDPNSYLGKLAASLTSPAIDPAAVYPSDVPPNPAALTLTSHGNGFWNSGALDSLAATPLPSANAVKFTQAGTYQFYCLVHPFMHGTVVVQ
jgi:plastocyanin